MVFSRFSIQALLTLAVATAPLTAGAAADTRGDALDPLDPLVSPAATFRQPASSVLISIARAGTRLVAVGDGGLVILSDDDGKSWRQASVPVGVTLTSVRFATPKRGWAVGHSGVILASADGGQTWALQFDGRKFASMAREGEEAEAMPVSAGDPLLDVTFVDASHGFAVGAFGLFMETRDGGQNWTDVRDRLPNPDGNHLYGIRAIRGDVFIVGERGSVFRSTDGGRSFDALPAPYAGSFFGLAAGKAGELLIYGLQGHAFSSRDGGLTWRRVAEGQGRAWTGAARLDDARLALVGSAGNVFVETSPAGAFEPMPGEHPPLSAAVAAPDGSLVAVGPAGVYRMAMPSTPERSKQK